MYIFTKNKNICYIYNDIFIFIIEYVRKEETGDYHRVANHLKHNSISD